MDYDSLLLVLKSDSNKRTKLTGYLKLLEDIRKSGKIKNKIILE